MSSLRSKSTPTIRKSRSSKWTPLKKKIKAKRQRRRNLVGSTSWKIKVIAPLGLERIKTVCNIIHKCNALMSKQSSVEEMMKKKAMAIVDDICTQFFYSSVFPLT